MKVRLQADLQSRPVPAGPFAEMSNLTLKSYKNPEQSEKSCKRKTNFCCPTSGFIVNTHNSLAHKLSKMEHLEINPYAYDQLTLTNIPKQDNKDENLFNTWFWDN